MRSQGMGDVYHLTFLTLLTFFPFFPRRIHIDRNGTLTRERKERKEKK